MRSQSRKKTRSAVLSSTAPSWVLKKTPADANRRASFLKDCLNVGGKQFLEAVKKYGVNERGEPIRFTNWLEESLLLIGDFRVSETFVTGVSQCSKTLQHNLLLTYAIAEAGITVLYAFDRQMSRNNQVKMNFWPVIQGDDGNGGWLSKSGQKRKSEGVSQNYDLYQLPNAGQVIFPYVSTSSTQSSGGAVGGSIAVGFSASLGIFEERSQYLPGSADVLKRRLDAGRIPTRPIRTLGTPGSGLGIEADIADAKYHFMPHCTCPSCDRPVKLDPFGTLLKPEIKVLPSGERRESYLSESGRPMQWFHSNEAKPVESAYFGCPHCAGALTGEARSRAWYECINTGIKLRDYLSGLPAGVPEVRQTAAIEITPLLRVEQVNTAAAIIEEGLNSDNTADFCQQRLGKPSISSTNGISLEDIRRAIAAPYPDRDPDVVLAGIDQARRDGDHVWINGVWLPEGWEGMNIPEIKEKAIRGCFLYKPVERNRLVELLDEFDVDYGLIDGEPGIESADLLSKKTVLETADQCDRLKNQVEKGVRESGGMEFEYWKIRNRDFQNDVLLNFTMEAVDGNPLMRLPDSWEKWVTLSKDERSPVRHLTRMQRDPDTRLWKRPLDEKDGAFYADLFCEAAFTIWLRGEPNKPFKGVKLQKSTIASVLY